MVLGRGADSPVENSQWLGQAVCLLRKQTVKAPVSLVPWQSVVNWMMVPSWQQEGVTNALVAQGP